MEISEALYTTRAMRRVRADPIPPDVQAKILDAAIRAPSGGNTQNWRFLLVDDRDVVGRIAPLYRHSIEQLWTTVYAERLAAAAADPEAPESIEMIKVQRSAQWLADHFEEVPLFLFGFVQADPTGGSIFPAVWSAQLAARAQGVGSSLTVVLGVFHPDETFEILGVPADEHWVMACCVSFGYPTGRWGVAPRRPVQEVSFRNRWGTPVGFTVDQPLWGTGLTCTVFRVVATVWPAPLCGCSSMVEPQFSKLMTRVRSPSAAPMFIPSVRRPAATSPACSPRSFCHWRRWIDLG